jgi:hypothetical protein
MARSDDHRPSAGIPDADWLEQEQSVDPSVGDDQRWPPAAPTQDVDDADRLEQAQAVTGDPDEEYIPDPP